MKRIIHIVAFFVFISLLITGCQIGKPSRFEIRNKVTWNSSLDDVRESENNNDVKYYNDADEKEESLSYKNISVSNYTDASLRYNFRDGVLVAVRYFFDDITGDGIENIYDSLKAKYGKHVKEDIQLCLDLMKAAGYDWTVFANTDRYHNYRNWKLPDGTFIVSWSDRYTAYNIVYLNGNELDKNLSKPNTEGL